MKDPLNPVLQPDLSGLRRFSHQWRFNGGNITGETNYILQPADVQFSNAGSYSVVASNALGFIEINPATLDVTGTAMFPEPLV